MEPNKGIQIAFRVLCLLVTFSMILYGTLKFMADKSTAIVDSKAFHNMEQDIYPTFSFCLAMDNPREPWWTNLELYDESILKNTYGIDSREKIKDFANFMMGNKEMFQKTIEVAKMMEVDYDKVTADIRKYIKHIIFISGDGDVVYDWSLGINSSEPFYISYRHPILKCFSMDLSKEFLSHNNKQSMIGVFRVEFDNKNIVFNASSKILLSYFLHYPKQLMRSVPLDMEPLGKTANVFTKLFSVDSMGVLRRRNSRESNCLSEESEKDDDLIIKRLVEKTGCRASYWPDIYGYTACNTMDQMFELRTPTMQSNNQEFLKKFEENPGKPCNQIYSIGYTVKTMAPRPGEAPPGDPNIKTIDVMFKTASYLEIRHVQAFNIESYIGNVGGYVGLFIGCALWQAPDFIEFLFKKMKWIGETFLGLNIRKGSGKK